MLKILLFQCHLQTNVRTLIQLFHPPKNATAELLSVLSNMITRKNTAKVAIYQPYGQPLGEKENKQMGTTTKLHLTLRRHCFHGTTVILRSSDSCLLFFLSGDFFGCHVESVSCYIHYSLGRVIRQPLRGPLCIVVTSNHLTSCCKKFNTTSFGSKLQVSNYSKNDERINFLNMATHNTTLFFLDMCFCFFRVRPCQKGRKMIFSLERNFVVM